jgi:uncharacterized RDD family membrane protein YckC
METENKILDDPFAENNGILVQQKLASKGKRFLTYIIDLIGFYLFSFIIGILLGIVGFANVLTSINEYILGILIVFVYYFFFELIFQRTPGKFLTGTTVVFENGDKPEPKTIIIRTLCRFIPFEAFSFLGKEPVGWHDSISKTRVINL